MELALPLFGAIKSQVSGYHLCYDQTKTVNFARATGNNVFSTNSKVQFERARTNSNYVHMRFCHSNKYWAKARSDSVASASKSNQTRIAATLSDINKQDEESFVSSEIEAFKGHNDKFLKVLDDGRLQFSSDDGSESEAHFQRSIDKIGNLVIKSVSRGLYWKFSSGSILVESPDPTDPNCWFQSIPVDGSPNIALRPLAISKYCERDTLTDCLNATASTITPEAELTVKKVPS